jgi:glycosyltransferase involved in cell wall biosynthesis
MKKLKICIVSREYPPETHYGGIGTYTYNLAKGLNSIGHRVYIIAMTTKDKDFIEEDHGICIHRISVCQHKFLGINLLQFTKYTLFPFSLFYSFLVHKKFSDLLNNQKFDVIDLPEHIGEGFFLLLFNNIPSVLRLYTPWSFFNYNNYEVKRNIFDYHIIKFMEKFSVNKATLITSPSQNLARLTNKFFSLKKNIFIIKNPIDQNLKFAKFLYPKAHKALLKVIFVGTLSNRKGADLLAEAIPLILKRNKNIVFYFIGRDTFFIKKNIFMKKYIEKVCQANDCLENVMFFEHLSYQELESIYRVSDILVAPSRYDNSPYSVIEAMKYSIPVIINKFGGSKEYVDHDVNGIVLSSNNSKNIAKAVIELSRKDKKYIAYSTAARKKIINICNRKLIANKTADLYINAIEKFRGLKY